MEFWQRHCGSGEFGNFKFEPEAIPIGLSHLSAIMLSVFIALVAGGSIVFLLEVLCDRLTNHSSVQNRDVKTRSSKYGRRSLEGTDGVNRFLNQTVSDPTSNLTGNLILPKRPTRDFTNAHGRTNPDGQRDTSFTCDMYIPAGAAAFGRLSSGLPNICVAFRSFTPGEVETVESLSQPNLT